jgi:aminopeptidase N
MKAKTQLPAVSIYKKLLGLLTLCLTSCAHTPPQSLSPPSSTIDNSKSGSLPQSRTEPPSSQQRFALSEALAMKRAKWISGIHYQLWFGLNASTSTFQGRTVVHFELAEGFENAWKALPLELHQSKILKLAVNGRNLTPALEKGFREKETLYNGSQIQLPSKVLQQGLNRLEVAYERAYSVDGQGLHRFKDPEDGQVYLYSHSEPFQANKFFPCFDQPNLKGTFELTVEAPIGWEVISNMLPRDPQKIDGQHNWEFPVSAPISTYLFELAAGPYVMREIKKSAIPIRLFARKSLAPYVEWDEWLETTKNGLEFFSEYFSTPYPYTKYDQLIVPEFNAGAMENPGAVTFSERYVHRTTISKELKASRNSTILHEMAHHWFGDLVTMDWWNGLWLNESFATLLSTIAQSKLAESPEESALTWLTFSLRSKRGAYYEDQLPTTHPVDGPVPSTDQAFSNFDAITYGKGASVLKQLLFLIGEPAWRKGLASYFAHYANANSRLEDFLSEMEKASGRDLSQWRKDFLETQGLNSISVSTSCKEEKLFELSLEQNGTPLRSHAHQVALYLPVDRWSATQSKAPPTTTSAKTKQSRLPLLKRVELLTAITSKATQTLPTQSSIACPALIDLNSTDQGYFVQKLTPQQSARARMLYSQIPDPLYRASLWQSWSQELWEGRLSAEDLLEFAIQILDQERSIKILRSIFPVLGGLQGDLVNALKILKPEARLPWIARLESIAWKQMTEVALQLPPGDQREWVLNWWDRWIQWTHLGSLQRLEDLLQEGFVSKD